MRGCDAIEVVAAGAPAVMMKMFEMRALSGDGPLHRLHGAMTCDTPKWFSAIPQSIFNAYANPTAGSVGFSFEVI
jgi:hypothetical protein